MALTMRPWFHPYSVYVREQLRQSSGKPCRSTRQYVYAYWRPNVADMNCRRQLTLSSLGYIIPNQIFFRRHPLRDEIQLDL